MILGLTCDGRKEALSLAIGEHESAKFRRNALNELKNRGVQDVMIICADGLTGIKDAISAAFPKTDYQRCMVHMVRNTLKYVASKDMKSFATDLKTIDNCLEIQVKPHYTQVMSYGRDLRLRALEYAKEGHSLTQLRQCSK